jgi:hypothetical protein
MELLSNKIGSNLPEVVVELDPSLPTFPPAGPTGQIIVRKVQTGYWVAGQLSLDDWSIIGPGQNPDLVIIRYLPCRGPAHCRLRTYSGFAGIGRKENL